MPVRFPASLIQRSRNKKTRGTPAGDIRALDLKPLASEFFRILFRFFSYQQPPKG